MKPITAAGGVVFKSVDNADNEPEVILIYRRGVWDLPKGKLDREETIKECAVREVAEEIGLSETPAITTKLVDTYHEYEQDRVLYGKTTHWYAMQLANSADVEFKPERQEGIEKVNWVDLQQAKQLVGYQNLLEVLNALDAWYNGKYGKIV